MIWVAQHPRFRPEMLGFLPEMFSDTDTRSAREQVEANYGHGGGWQPIPGFTLTNGGKRLNYPGDPPLHLLASAMLREEMILFFEVEMVVILQPDGSFEVSRMD